MSESFPRPYVHGGHRRPLQMARSEPHEFHHSKTIEMLRELFSRYGLPEVLVSDNNPQFMSSGF